MKVTSRSWGRGRRSIGIAAVIALVASVFVGAAAASATVTVGTAGLFVPFQVRLVDSAVPKGTTLGNFEPGVPRTIQITGAGGLPATDVSAVMLTFMTVNTVTAGQMSAGPADGNLAGVMRYDAANYTTNSGIVTVSAAGQIKVQTSTSTRVLIDVQGYYTSGNGVTAAGGYAPVQMTRIVDTGHAIGLPGAPLQGGSTTTIQVAGKANVPAGAAAAFVNFQIDNTTAAPGAIDPFISASAPGVALAFPGNVPSAHTTIGAIVPLNSAGAFKLLVSNGNTINLLVDVEGYFTPGNTDGAFTPAIGKIYDTRSGTHVAPGQTVTIPVGGTNGIPDTTAGLSAVAYNLTVVDLGTKGGYVRTWADGATEPPGVGTLNFDAQPAGTMTTNLTTTPVGISGAIQIHNVSTDSIDLIIDLQGFFSTSAVAAVSCDSPYQDRSWTAVIPPMPIECRATLRMIPGVSTEASITVDGEDVDTSAVTASSGTTVVPVTVRPDGGEHVILASVLDASGVGPVTEYTFTMGDWTAAPLAGQPSDRATVAVAPVLAVSTADDSRFPAGAARVYSVSAHPDMSDPIATSASLADAFTVPAGVLAADVTYYWRVSITGVTDYEGHSATITSPVWSFTTSSEATETDPTAGQDAPATAVADPYLTDPAVSAPGEATPAGIQYGACTLQVPNPHLRKYSGYSTVGVKPITKCPRELGQVPVSNTTKMYWVAWYLWTLQKGPAFNASGKTDGKKENQFIQKNPEISCNGTASTWWIGQTTSTDVERGRTYHASAVSFHQQLACGA